MMDPPRPFKLTRSRVFKVLSNPNKPLTVREVAVVGFGLAIVGLFSFLPHALHGGFYMDDWADSAGAAYPPGGRTIGNVLSYFYELFEYRPGSAVYISLKYLLLGTHLADHVALSVALAVIVGILIYGILRTLGVPWYHGCVIAGLTIIYPWFDSVRLWESANPPVVSVALALGGLWVALVGLAKRSWRWHAAAALLYLASILTYEITLPLVAVAGSLYFFRAGWKVARARWGIDLIVVVIGGYWVGIHTTREVYGVSAYFSHLKEIITGGGTILGRTLLPFDTHPHTAIALWGLTCIMFAGIAACFLLPERFERRSGWGLLEWLFLSGGGLLVAALGWIMFIPADSYYTPSVYGMTNRVNALAGIGLVTTVYAAFGVAGTLIGTLLIPRLRVLALSVTLFLGVLLGAAYVHVLQRHIRVWDAAFQAELAALSQIRSQFPTLPVGSTVFMAGNPANQTLGVPIFTATWDLNGAIKLIYHDGSLSAYPVILGGRLICTPTGVGMMGAGESGTIAPYGAARLLNVQGGQRAVVHGQRQCESIISEYAAGPSYLSTAY